MIKAPKTVMTGGIKLNIINAYHLNFSCVFPLYFHSAFHVTAEDGREKGQVSSITLKI